MLLRIWKWSPRDTNLQSSLARKWLLSNTNLGGLNCVIVPQVWNVIGHNYGWDRWYHGTGSVGWTWETEQPLEPDEADKSFRAGVWSTKEAVAAKISAQLWSQKVWECARHVQTRMQQRGEESPEVFAGIKEEQAGAGKDSKIMSIGFPGRDPPSCLDLTFIFWPRGWRWRRHSFGSKGCRRSEEERNHPHQQCFNVSITWINMGCCVFGKPTPTLVSDGCVNKSRQTKAAVNIGNSATALLGPLCRSSWWLILETLNKYCCVHRAKVRAVKITSYIWSLHPVNK